MLDTAIIREIFEDNGFLTRDDGDFNAMFIIVESDAGYALDLQDICNEFDLTYDRIDDESWAIFANDYLQYNEAAGY